MWAALAQPVLGLVPEPFVDSWGKSPVKVTMAKGGKA